MKASGPDGIRLPHSNGAVLAEVPQTPSHLQLLKRSIRLFLISAMAKSTSSVSNFLKRFLKKPWEFTGPQTSPEYLPSISKATEYRIPSPATFPIKACIPTSNPETVFDIKYFSRDQRRNRPPIRKTVLKKADVEKMMKEKISFSVDEFPRVYLTDKVQEDENTIGGGYQK
ncbi:hypothetical protein SAY86_005569 [Trapa natans]|uniref:Uncharacterized protein n=1 Tax=Trapa natans TaxID=22666 RepID=A0AAN7QTL2_TRANT|nr:hypothetical protein SAY86_005569 [Trapa natans]